METDTSTLKALVDRLCNAIDGVCIAIEDASKLLAHKLTEIDKSIGYIELSHND